VWGVVNDPDCVANPVGGPDIHPDPTATGVVGMRKFPTPGGGATMYGVFVRVVPRRFRSSVVGVGTLSTLSPRYGRRLYSSNACSCGAAMKPLFTPSRSFGIRVSSRNVSQLSLDS